MYFAERINRRHLSCCWSHKNTVRFPEILVSCGDGTVTLDHGEKREKLDAKRSTRFLVRHSPQVVQDFRFWRGVPGLAWYGSLHAEHNGDFPPMILAFSMALVSTLSQLSSSVGTSFGRMVVVCWSSNVFLACSPVFVLNLFTPIAPHTSRNIVGPDKRFWV